MPTPHSQRVELLQGNATLRRLMTEVLDEAGFEVLVNVPDDDGAPSDELADLLIVDVDSGVGDFAGLREAYEEAGIPVVLAGLRHSRESHDDPRWLARPFAPSALLDCARAALSLDADADDLAAGPPTAEISGDVARDLEGELGIEAGALTDRPTRKAHEPLVRDEGLSEPTSEPDEIDADEDADEPIVLEVEDLDAVEISELGHGGRRTGELEREALDLDALDAEIEAMGPPAGLASPGPNQTLPDAPSALEPPSEGVLTEEAGPAQAVEGTGPARRETTGGARSALPSDVARDVAQTARLLSEAWDRLALAARPADRADRLERILAALLHTGAEGAAAELDRVPGGAGMSGDLEVMGLEGLLGLIEARELRGRLEVSTDADRAFVLYLEGGQLHDIEDLGAGRDGLLLELLAEAGALDASTHDMLRADLDDELAPPLEMRLRTDRLVEADELREARRQLARHLFDELMAAGQTGAFAFMAITTETGHGWPVNQLELPVDALLGAHAGADSEASLVPESESSDTHQPPGGLREWSEGDDEPLTRPVTPSALEGEAAGPASFDLEAATRPPRGFDKGLDPQNQPTRPSKPAHELVPEEDFFESDEFDSILRDAIEDSEISETDED